jgi:carbonic anhydrase
MKPYEKLLIANQNWIQERTKVQPDYFEKLAKHQRPDFLWIGCSDSRVPAEEVTGAQPGELFVHRNIANVVVHTDLNLLSVLNYAVEFLEIPHIIVCGHYGCGGVRAALTHRNFGLLNKWLRNIKDVYHTHTQELSLLDEGEQRSNRLVELNVIEQVHNLTRTSIVQKAWHKHKRPTVHGWVYEMKTGKLHDLVRIEPGAPLEDLYRYDFPEES